MTHGIGLPRRTRELISFFAMVALSALAVLLAQHLLTPSRATAQAGQAQVVRASAFELVATDGTVLARLAVNSNGGSVLTLDDVTGTRRLELNGRGVLNSFDTDGTTARFRAGYLPAGQGARWVPSMVYCSTPAGRSACCPRPLEQLVSRPARQMSVASRSGGER